MRTTYRTQRPTRPGSALARRAQLMSRHDLLKAAPSLGRQLVGHRFLDRRPLTGVGVHRPGPVCHSRREAGARAG